MHKLAIRKTIILLVLLLLLPWVLLGNFRGIRGQRAMRLVMVAYSLRGAVEKEVAARYSSFKVKEGNGVLSKVLVLTWRAP